MVYSIYFLLHLFILLHSNKLTTITILWSTLYTLPQNARRFGRNIYEIPFNLGKTMTMIQEFNNAFSSFVEIPPYPASWFIPLLKRWAIRSLKPNFWREANYILKYQYSKLFVLWPKTLWLVTFSPLGKFGISTKGLEYFVKHRKENIWVLFENIAIYILQKYDIY